jgi:hypothetical protein
MISLFFVPAFPGLPAQPFKNSIQSVICDERRESRDEPFEFVTSSAVTRLQDSNIRELQRLRLRRNRWIMGNALRDGEPAAAARGPSPRGDGDATREVSRVLGGIHNCRRVGAGSKFRSAGGL